ncbi:MAG: hypothetical protein Q8R28_01660, partial [Dehalococcoidia bacterium]|nr:hypothetical protein [Dehalococcoidia bacterium]
AVLDLKTIQVAPDNPYVGGLVSIFVTGDAPVAGAYSVSLKIDGILVDTQTVQLGAGYTGYIGLNWIPSAPGIYLAEVDNLSIQFTVLAGGNPIWFMVPASPTLADAAALLAKIQASPYRTPLTLWGEPFPGWPAVELEDAVTHAIMMPEDQLVEISGYVNPNTGEIGNWYGPMYLVPTGYMPRAVMSLPIWARQIYLLMAEL